MTELSKPSVPLTAAKGLPVVAVVHDSGPPFSMVLFDETKKVMLKRYVRSERDHALTTGDARKGQAPAT